MLEDELIYLKSTGAGHLFFSEINFSVNDYFTFSSFLFQFSYPLSFLPTFQYAQILMALIQTNQLDKRFANVLYNCR